MIPSTYAKPTDGDEPRCAKVAPEGAGKMHPDTRQSTRDTYTSLDPVLARRARASVGRAEPAEDELLVVYAYCPASATYLADDRRTDETVEVRADEVEWFDLVKGWGGAARPS